ncbi:MAG TPA: hypothetical protein VEO37_09405, partial [Thermoanaerobaculia bacterium]|nr:hypothetical protein [Thermoanaerobaculia bacterium]
MGWAVVCAVVAGAVLFATPSAQAQCFITVNPATLLNGTVGVPYSQTITANGCLGPPYTYTSTALPPGLSLTPTTPTTSATLSG